MWDTYICIIIPCVKGVICHLMCLIGSLGDIYISQHPPSQKYSMGSARAKPLITNPLYNIIIPTCYVIFVC